MYNSGTKIRILIHKTQL